MMKTVRESKVEKSILRLVEHNKTYVGIVISNGAKKLQVEGSIADDVWKRLHDELAKTNPKFVGYDGARIRFLSFFPKGFQSDGYADQERDYKVAAKAKLDAGAPLDAAISGSGFGEVVLSVFRATNLLSPFEKTRLQDLLRGPAADTFIRAAAKFTMTKSAPSLAEMRGALQPYDSAKWTVATYLPYLWRPEVHMFLKPEVTKDFAARVGHRFGSDYDARLSMDVYDSLIALVVETESELVELKPRDRIDVQSFIWVVGSYEEPKV